jgi:hypothetical protein
MALRNKMQWNTWEPQSSWIQRAGCFGSHYTIANISLNAVDIQKANLAGLLAAIKAKFMLEKGTKSLRRYLELAPKGHWHAPRA